MFWPSVIKNSKTEAGTSSSLWRLAESTLRFLCLGVAVLMSSLDPSSLLFQQRFLPVSLKCVQRRL